MTLKIAIQMDDIANINTETDSTYLLAIEAYKRYGTLYYYQPKSAFLKNGVLYASLQTLALYPGKDPYFELGEAQEIPLQEMDVILMRQDPPYSMHYLTYTYYLSQIQNNVLVLNNPEEVRNCPEKLFACQFPDLMPQTIVSESDEVMTAFLAEQGKIILKPLYAHGGADIHLIHNQSELDKTLPTLLQQYQTPLMAQEFLPNVTQGDKRILLLEGEVVGATNRIPAKGDILSNMVRGGEATKTTLTERDLEICQRLRPHLKQRGLFFVGIDVIDGHLTEINVTSPTGIAAINAHDDIQIEALFWDRVEKIKQC